MLHEATASIVPNGNASFLDETTRQCCSGPRAAESARTAANDATRATGRWRLTAWITATQTLTRRKRR